MARRWGTEESGVQSGMFGADFYLAVKAMTAISASS